MSNIINKIRLSGTDYTLSATTSGGVTSGEVETMISAATSGYTARFAEDEEVTAAALNDLNERISGISGNNVVELTQAEYDALVSGGTVDPTAFYIITDATPIDISNYWTSAQTQSAITSAVSGKQDTLSAGTNITISGNVISAEGGGKAIEAGRGISITTGETADTVSFNLPISATSSDNSGLIFNIIDGASKNKANGQLASAFGISNNASGRASFVIGSSNTGTGESSFVGGANSEARGTESFAFGYMAKAIGDYSIAFGSYYPLANNTAEVAIGKANVSHTGSTDADKTLFSVGNGTNNNTRHNAFEIRQNGDIYLSLNGQDVKLQDQLGGGEVSSAITSGDTNAVAGGAVYDKFDEVEQVTAAGLNAVNSALGGLKLVSLTQAEYNALATKDASTLYIIVN